jgi:phage terminase large subunit GpA-like protein
MMSWKDALRDFNDYKNDPDKAPAASNLILAQTYQETGSRPKLDKVIKLRGLYAEGTIPKGVLYLTMGVDVQKGSETDTKKPPRLEIEILGTGAGYRTWSILYKVIPGAVTDAYSGAWEELYQWVTNGGLTFVRHDGVEFSVELGFFDCGYGVKEYLTAVYNFCQRLNHCYPAKGFKYIEPGESKGGKVKKTGIGNFKRYRAAKVSSSGDQFIYEISTILYKTSIYNRLEIPRQPDAENQKPGFCDFPSDRLDEYFKGLTAEDKLADGSFESFGRWNDPLDCRVMASCAADVFLDDLVEQHKKAAQKLGARPDELNQINQKFIIQLLEKERAFQKQGEIFEKTDSQAEIS